MATAASPGQAVIAPMRLMLYVAGGLVFITGVQLFVLTEATDRFFAWTIQPPLTAAFLGAAYWSACLLELAAARQAAWARARVAVPAVLAFTALTFVVTLLHLDKFHFASEDPLARGAAWAWTLVYALVPILLGAILALQLRRASAGDPPREREIPFGLAALLSFHALVMLALGVAALAAPAILIAGWPWKLTPLTARAIGAWMVGLGLAVGQSLWENDRRRIGPATYSYILFGALELVALARYAGAVDWSRPAAWAYLLFMLSVLAAGLWGWRALREVRG